MLELQTPDMLETQKTQTCWKPGHAENPDMLETQTSWNPKHTGTPDMPEPQTCRNPRHAGTPENPDMPEPQKTHDMLESPDIETQTCTKPGHAETYRKPGHAELRHAGLGTRHTAD
jgi:hypothetical protein